MCAWRLTVEGDEVEHEVAQLGVTSRLGDEAWVDAQFAAAIDDYGLSPGATAWLSVGDADVDRRIPELRLVGYWLSGGHTHLRFVAAHHYPPGQSDAEDVAPGVLLVQRGDDESAWSCLARIGDAGHLAEEPDRSQLDEERLSSICPPGWTMALPAEASRPSRLYAAIEQLHIRSREFVGLTRRPCSPSSLTVALFVSEDSEERRLELEAGDWRLGAPGANGALILTKSEIWHDPRVAIGQVFDCEAAVLRGAGGSTPLAPRTITFNGDHYLVSSCTTVMIDQAGRDAPGANVMSTLTLVPWRLVRPKGTSMGSALFAGKVVEASLPEDTYRIAVVPPTTSDMMIDAPIALQQWTLASPQQALLCAAVSPGFVRPDRTAFYARWALDDLVCFTIASGGVPTVLGGLWHRESTKEQGAAEIVMMGAGVVLQAVALGDPVATLSLAQDGKASLAGQEELMLQQVMKLKQPGAELNGNLKVSGDIDVD